MPEPTHTAAVLHFEGEASVLLEPSLSGTMFGSAYVLCGEQRIKVTVELLPEGEVYILAQVYEAP